MQKYQLKMPHWPKPVWENLAGTPRERTKALLTTLGNPEKNLPPVIHIGGTKGKGSTLAFLRTILQKAGYIVHSYTSPHLHHFNERINLAGEPIADDYLYTILERTRLAADTMPLAFFDATTAAAMLAFASIPADILLMEVGLGGAIDATNVIENPLLTILTTVSRDHIEYMGNSLPEIARFEAGIFKTYVPAIISYQDEQALAEIEAAALASNTPLYQYGKHWQIRKNNKAMVFQDHYGEVELPLPSLPGSHQIVNAGNAIAAISALTDFEVTQQHIIAGLMQTEWRGRLEKVSCHFLPKDCEIWFDGGHNEAASQVISHYAQEHWQDKPLYLIFGTTKGKELLPMLRPFVGVAEKIYAVSVQSEPKSYLPEIIKEKVEPEIRVEVSKDITQAIQAISKNSATPFRILVFGSLYLWLEANNL